MLPLLGFIGLGAMGLPMAQRLLAAGYPLIVYNRTPSRAESLRFHGATVANSPQEIAQAAAIIITMVSDSDAVVDISLGEGELWASLRPGSIMIDMSTISPETTRQIADALSAVGSAMLGAPVSGGVQGALTGNLSIMVGGDAEIFQRCLPIFQVLGKTVTYVGGNGVGQTLKLVNQVVGMGTLAAIAEGLILAQTAGLDIEQTIKALEGGAAASWQLTNTGRLIATANWEAGFRVALGLKDMHLALAEASRLGVSTPVTEIVARLFERRIEQGEGDRGVQTVGKPEQGI